MKKYERVDVQIHSFLTSALLEEGQFHASAILPPEKEPLYPLDRKLGGLQSRSGRYAEMKILEAKVIT
jgi:hypothetical protein